MQKFGGPSPISLFELTAKPHSLTPSAFANDVFKPDKRPTADEKDIGRIHLKELLLRVFSATLRRYTRHRCFTNLQQRLLYTFARDISGNRRIVRLPGDVLDVVASYDSALGSLYAVVRSMRRSDSDDIT